MTPDSPTCRGELPQELTDLDRLRERDDQWRRTIRRLFHLTRRIATGLPAPDLHDWLVRQAVSAVGATQGALALFVPEEGCLRVRATVGYPATLVEHVSALPGEGIIGRVFATRRPLLVRDIARQRWLHAPRRRYRTASFIAVPIREGREVLGVLCLSDPADGLTFGAGELRIARCLAAAAAVALRADRLARKAALLQEWATMDPLTGLYNRRFFEQRLQEETERARRHSLPFSLVLLDIDDFKRINDTMGHAAGDATLRRVADVVRGAVRAFDICCRYGGEEIALLLPEATAADALASAERMREAIGGQPLAHRSGRQSQIVTVSVGIATLTHVDGVSDLIHRADRALYAAKAAGKNCVRGEDAPLIETPRAG